MRINKNFPGKWPNSHFYVPPYSIWIKFIYELLRPLATSMVSLFGIIGVQIEQIWAAASTAGTGGRLGFRTPQKFGHRY